MLYVANLSTLSAACLFNPYATRAIVMKELKKPVCFFSLSLKKKKCLPRRSLHILFNIWDNWNQFLHVMKQGSKLLIFHKDTLQTQHHFLKRQSFSPALQESCFFKFEYHLNPGFDVLITFLLYYLLGALQFFLSHLDL